MLAAVRRSAPPCSLLIRIEEALIVIVFLVYAHYTFVYLPHHTLSLLKLINIALDHYELVFNVSALNLRVKFLLAQITIR